MPDVILAKNAKMADLAKGQINLIVTAARSPGRADPSFLPIKRGLFYRPRGCKWQKSQITLALLRGSGILVFDAFSIVRQCVMILTS